MILECANPECRELFTPTKHNQVFHNTNCCKIVTNKRIMEAYYENKARKSGKPRYCKKCKGKLSRYNVDKVCQPCQVGEKEAERISLLELIF